MTYDDIQAFQKHLHSDTQENVPNTEEKNPCVVFRGDGAAFRTVYDNSYKRDAPRIKRRGERVSVGTVLSLGPRKSK